MENPSAVTLTHVDILENFAKSRSRKHKLDDAACDIMPYVYFIVTLAFSYKHF
jgi:hypothetical protein